MLCHLKAVRRQLGMSRISPAPLFMVGPLSHWSSPTREKNLGLLWKAGWFFLTFGVLGLGRKH